MARYIGLRWLDLLENVLDTNIARCKFSRGDTPTLVDVYLVAEIWFAQRLSADLPSYPALQCTYRHCMDVDVFKRVASIFA
jgi:maleylpyruvate isomerase